LAVGALRRPAPAPFAATADEAALAGIDPDRTFPPVVVLIAAYNEADGIGAVLDTVPPKCCGLDVASLVVVDGATDGTADVARAHGAVTCVVPVNRGQGAALRLGYHLVAQRGARFVVTTDADGQYDMAELPALLEPLVAGTADFVTGSRRLGANESTDPVRRLGTRVFAALVSLLTRQRITDTSFGFRAMRAEILHDLTLTQPQYQSSELLIGVLSRGYRVVERPMTMRRRAQGRRAGRDPRTLVQRPVGYRECHRRGQRREPGPEGVPQKPRPDHLASIGGPGDGPPCAPGSPSQFQGGVEVR